jgi:hypothetical protein
MRLVNLKPRQPEHVNESRVFGIWPGAGKCARFLFNSENMPGPSKENALRPDIGGNIPLRVEMFRLLSRA